MMTREEAQAIYRAGEETVVRLLLEMDQRIHTLDRRVEELQAEVQSLKEQLAQQPQATLVRWTRQAQAEEPAPKE